jgi:hypothetical protein
MPGREARRDNLKRIGKWEPQTHIYPPSHQTSGVEVGLMQIAFPPAARGRAAAADRGGRVMGPFVILLLGIPSSIVGRLIRVISRPHHDTITTSSCRSLGSYLSVRFQRRPVIACVERLGVLPDISMKEGAP